MIFFTPIQTKSLIIIIGLFLQNRLILQNIAIFIVEFVKTAINMIIKYALCFGLLCFLSLCNTIEAREKKAPPTGDSLLMYNLNQTAWNYRNNQPDSSKIFAQKALGVKKHPAYNLHASISYNILGIYYRKKAQYDSSLFYFNKSMELRKTLHDTAGQARCLLNIGNVQKDRGHFLESIETFKKAINLLKPLAQTPQNREAKASILNAMSHSQLELGELHDALQTALESYTIREQLDDPLTLARSALSLGNIYEQLNYYTEASNYYTQAIEIFKVNDDISDLAKALKGMADVFLFKGNYTESEKIYIQCIELNQQMDAQAELADVYSNLGYQKENQHELSQAISWQQKALQIYFDINDQFGLAVTYNHLGYLELKRRNFSKAISHFNKTVLITDSIKALSLLIDAYGGLAQAYFNLHKYKESLFYELKSKGLKQQSFEDYTRAIKLLAEEKRLRQNVEKDNAIIQLNLEKEKEILLRREWEKYGLLAGIILITLLFFSLYRYNRQKQKRRQAEQEKKIAQQGEEIKQRQLEQMLQEHKVHTMDALLEGQQKERQRVAQDIHDRLGSLLSVLKIHFSEVIDDLNSFKEKSEKRLHQVNDLLDQAADTCREISNNLRSGILDEFGLIPALEDLCQRVQETGMMSVELFAQSLRSKQNSDFEWMIYRNIEESLNNILRHSNATNVTVQLFQGKEHISISVEDNGNGFDPTAKASGMGLQGIKLRTSMHKGTLSIDSKPGRGTIILMDFKQTE